MESDDDYESFSFPNNEPSPSPKPRRLKRLKKSTVVALQSTTVETVTQLGLPRVDFARLEALESSDTLALDDSIEQPSEGFDGDENELNRLRSGFDDSLGNGFQKETKRSLRFEEDFDDEGKVKELVSCYDDAQVNSNLKETTEGLECEEDFDDGETETNLSSGVGDAFVRTDRKETKRALDFEEDVNEIGEVQSAGEEKGNADMEIREDGEKVVDEDVIDEKKRKKKKLKSSGDDPKAKTSKRREEKERRAYLEQLHVESQRLLRETRGVSFKPAPPVQKPISSVLEKIRQRKLEVSKKFLQSSTNEHAVADHSKRVETEVSDLPESVKEEKVSDVPNGDPEPVDVGMNGPDFCEEEGDVKACSEKDLNVESTPALRAPVDDTQELFGDSQTSDSKESENDESSEQEASSSQEEEEMGPSLLTMKLKFDSAPDDICDEEENDKENVDPHIQKHSSPRGDPVKAFVDDEAEEEDDSDNGPMVFGDDEDGDGDEDDIEELNKMIATGYKERPIDLETRNELHQKWLEEKDAAGTDDLLRRLNVASKLTEPSLPEEEDEEINDDDDDDDRADEEEDGDDATVVERPCVTRINSKKAKEMIAQMFNEKDDLFISDEDEETEKILARERLRNKEKEKDRLVSLIEDEKSREVFGLIKKQNTVPEGRKKANTTSFFDAMLTGGNSNSSSMSSFLSRNHSFPVPSKQGGSSGVRSFIFGRDDSNSRSSISVSEDIPDPATSRDVQTTKVTTKYKGSQSQVRSSTQTAELVSENSSSSSSSFFEILKRSTMQSSFSKPNHDVELSQSVFAAFKIPKKPVKFRGQA